ncbi:MAG: methylated-DNA--[protein]-cysteine S-methyltransferase [Betaproteobacteria bacterium]|nr:methylated-DNA--[protein]-cysteine S-methyltransferase [Betaproteobacteria bacterium]
MKSPRELTSGYSACVALPFAVIGVRTQHDRLVGLEYLPLGAATLAPLDALAKEVTKQLHAFIRDARFRFELPHEIHGTDFQRSVWERITMIPGGSTRSYGEIAKSIKTSARAVGTCCGANRFPLIIPCHRVVAAHGIGGFMHTRSEGTALNIKRWLLQHEGALHR